MTPAELREARKALGLTMKQMAVILETDYQSIRRMEMNPAAKTARKPSVRMVRLINAYLAGYRPEDWPKGE